MKKRSALSLLRIFATASVTVIMLLSLLACNITQSGNGDQGGSNTPPPSSDNGVDTGTDAPALPQIVINDDLGSDVQSKLNAAFLDELGEAVKIVDDTAAVADREIIIGSSSREIYKKAELALSRLDVDEGMCGYVIYSDGETIVVAYAEDKYDTKAAAMKAVDYLLESIVPEYSDTELEKGVIHTGSVSPIEYQRELDTAARELIWLSLEATAGAETVKALREYYEIYTESFVTWCADLYDPETGAFYYSNSARNTNGYLPDIETTFQMLSMLESSGMIDHIGGKPYHLPEWFLLKMANWVKGLQHPNGYLYHPQWGQQLTDTKVTRRGRDLDYGGAILNYAGVSFTYDTPAGAKGDYTLVDGTKVDRDGNPIAKATSALTHRFVTGAAVAVSKVTPTATAVPAHLENAMAFKNYLNAFDIRGNCYWVANQLSNQTGQIAFRNSELGGTLVPVLEQWLIENQNPETGTWDWKSESDSDFSYYTASDGILKFLTLYNGLGMEFPNPDKAAKNIVKSIYTDQVAGSVCQTYNSWFALEDLFKNLNEHTKDPTATEKMISEIRESLRADAPSLIRNSLAKVLTFMKEDGSSSFGPQYSADTSQGMRVAVPKTNEGDVNGTLINNLGVANHMFNVLGYTRPKPYGKADYMVFMDIVENQTPVVKIPEPDPIPIDFDDWSIDQTPEFVNLERCASSGKKVVVKSTRPGDSGKMFMFESKADGNDTIWFETDSQNLTASCKIFETDMFYEATPNHGYIARLYMDQAYSLGLYVKNGCINFLDISSGGSNRVEQDLGFTAPINEWFKIRIEYYIGDVDTVRIKIYINDELKAVSGNFYDPDGKKYPHQYYNNAKMEIFNGAAANVYFDNMMVTTSNTVYKEISDPNNQPAVNVDSPDRESVVYDFDDLEIGTNKIYDWKLLTGTSGTKVTEMEDGNELLIKGVDSSFEIMLNKLNREANASRFESDITVNSFVDGTKIQILFTDRGLMGTNVMRLWLIPTTEDGEEFIAVHEAINGVLGERLEGVKLPIGEKFTFRMDYYENEKTALVYLNNSLVGITSACEPYASRTVSAKLQVHFFGGRVNAQLDNVKAERFVGSFDEATMPEKATEVHTFEGALGNGVELGGATVTADAIGNKVVSFKAGGTLKIPVNKRSIFGGTVIFNASLGLPKDTKDGETLYFSIVDEAGAIMFRYALVVRNGAGTIYEVTASNTYTNELGSILLGATVELGIEYYEKKDTVQISINDVCTGVTSISYTPDSNKLAAAFVTVSADSSTAMTLDNVVVESFNKLYVKRTISAANADDSSDVMGFEYSTTASLPRYLSSDLRTAAAALRVKEMMIRGKASKVLAFDTSNGANDMLYVSNTNSASGNASVFEADLYFDLTPGETTYEFYFTDGANNYAYMLLMKFDANGNLVVQDCTGNSSANVPGRIFGTAVTCNAKQREWFNFRVEYIDGDADTVRIKTYVNDELVYVSKAFYGLSTTVPGTAPRLNPPIVRLSSYGAVIGTVYLDNVSYKRTNLSAGNDPLTHTPVIP